MIGSDLGLILPYFLDVCLEILRRPQSSTLFARDSNSVFLEHSLKLYDFMYINYFGV